VASQSVFVYPVAKFVWQFEERRVGCVGNRAVWIKSVGCCMICLPKLRTYMTLLAMGDFLRFNSLDGLLFCAIDSVAGAILSDSAVAEDESLVCWQDVELVMLVADGRTYIIPELLSQAVRTRSLSTAMKHMLPRALSKLPHGYISRSHVIIAESHARLHSLIALGLTCVCVCSSKRS
jgi:hypothetical protein